MWWHDRCTIKTERVEKEIMKAKCVSWGTRSSTQLTFQHDWLISFFVLR